jgi:hypothetical protein
VGLRIYQSNRNYAIAVHRSGLSPRNAPLLFASPCHYVGITQHRLVRSLPGSLPTLPLGPLTPDKCYATYLAH